MRQITIEDRTFELLSIRSRGEGFAGFPEYLDSLASEPDEFEMPPDVDAALEKGMEDVRAGRTVEESVVREGIQRMRREWAERGRRGSNTPGRRNAISRISGFRTPGATVGTAPQPTSNSSGSIRRSEERSRYGQPVPGWPRFRRLTARKKSGGYGHIAFYTVEEHLVVVVRVLHTSRDWPDLLEDE